MSFYGVNLYQVNGLDYIYMMKLKSIQYVFLHTIFGLKIFIKKNVTKQFYK
jgi:hypothetical protein